MLSQYSQSAGDDVCPPPPHRKQRRKLHEHLRQSLRNKRNGGGAPRGHAPVLPLRDLLNVGHPLASPPPDATLTSHGRFLPVERGDGTLESQTETETSFSPREPTSSTQEVTTFSQLSSQRSESWASVST